jgi:hypothetical protein
MLAAQPSTNFQVAAGPAGLVSEYLEQNDDNSVNDTASIDSNGAQATTQQAAKRKSEEIEEAQEGSNSGNNQQHSVHSAKRARLTENANAFIVVTENRVASTTGESTTSAAVTTTADSATATTSATAVSTGTTATTGTTMMILDNTSSNVNKRKTAEVIANNDSSSNKRARMSSDSDSDSTITTNDSNRTNNNSSNSNSNNNNNNNNNSIHSTTASSSSTTTPAIAFTHEQQEYIECEDLAAAQIDAIAGAGKTTSFAERIILLRQNRNCRLTAFFVTTFTKEAAKHLKQKLQKRLLLDHTAQEVETELNLFYCGTFHALARRILLEYQVFDQSQLHQIDKDEMQYHFLRFLSTPPGMSAAVDDFRSKIQFVFVDEYQDVNKVQYDIMMALATNIECGVNVVGDENQNIYSFRGSNVYYFRSFITVSAPQFRIKPLQCQRYRFSINQRSNPGINRLAQESIAHNYIGARWNERPRLISYQDLPTFTGTRSTQLPILVNHANSFVSASWVCDEIYRLVKRERRYRANHIAVICRSNYLLHLIETTLRRKGIKCVFDCGEDQFRRDIPPQFVEDRVRLLTAHGAKALEFPVVFGLGYHNDFFPDKREKDIEKERRLHYTLITRAEELLYLCNAMDNPSIFLMEVPLTLFQTTMTSWPEGAYERARLAIAARRHSPLELPSHVGVTALIKTLNGECFLALKEQGLLNHTLLDLLHCIEHNTCSALLPANYINSNNNNDSINNNNNLLAPLLQAGSPELVTVHSEDSVYQQRLELGYKHFITREMIEIEFGIFLDFLARRMIHELSPHLGTRMEWSDKSADACILGEKQRSVPFHAKQSVSNAYLKVKNFELSWRELLYPIWVLSWCGSFVRNRQHISLIPVRELELKQYMPMFEKMYYRFTHLCRNAQSVQTGLTVRYVVPTAAAGTGTDNYNNNNNNNNNNNSNTNTNITSTVTSNITSTSELVGELDLLCDNVVLDFKNYLVNPEYLPLEHLLQVLLYAVMTNQSMFPNQPERHIKYVCTYNIIADTWFQLRVDDWLNTNGVPLCRYLMQHFHRQLIENNSLEVI